MLRNARALTDLMFVVAVCSACVCNHGTMSERSDEKTSLDTCERIDTTSARQLVSGLAGTQFGNDMIRYTSLKRW